MKPEPDADQDLVERSKAAFDASVGQLDTRTLSRLRISRERALDSTPWRGSWAWLPAAGLVAAGIVGAVILMTRWNSPATEQFAASDAAAEDMALLLASEQLELLDEVEFYAWLDSESVNDSVIQPAANPI